MRSSGPAEPQPAWVQAVQRLAGNQAVAAMLAVQRDEPAVPTAPAPAAPTSAGAGPGREPTPEEIKQWSADLPNLTNFRIVIEPTYGFNCFAWAVGITSRDITSDTIFPFGCQASVEGWTKYLVEQHGFGRHVDGLDPSADVILYGHDPGWVWHAARKAAEPLPPLTFTSKLGGQNKSPVVLHEPAAVAGGGYGNALRSLWLGGAPEPAQEPAAPPAP